MVNVQFDEPTDGGITIYERLEAPKRAIIGFLINREVVKDEAGANRLMLGVIAACLIFIISFIFLTNRKPSGTKVLTDEQVIAISAAKP